MDLDITNNDIQKVNPTIHTKQVKNMKENVAFHIKSPVDSHMSSSVGSISSVPS
jgi:hypothetical protein